MSESNAAFEAFKRALDQDPDLDLRLYFAEHGVEDEDLRIRIEDHAFLAGALRAGLGASPSTSGSADPAEPIPETLAGYRVLRRLGSGGMGTVYLVEQLQPVHRTCALKVIRSDVSNREILRRFETERQAISQMEHENIARLYGAGATAQGQPYFVMEYVEGSPITTYADDHELGLEERIELIRDLCHGVQHAHQKGILHRDLKPSNVLVCKEDGRARVKIIDFGLARALDRKQTEQSLVTIAGQIIGTPGYMSPEQAGVGDTDVDARTDVYSLGAILYELLCGTPPLYVDKSRSMWLADLQRSLREEEPAKPSSRSTTRGGTRSDSKKAPPVDTSDWRHKIRGDLDWITLKALDKDRDHRYRWPSDLAEDLDRYLKHEPVVAAPPGARRSIRKFLWRNRIAASLLGAATVLILGSLTALLSLRFSHARRVGPRAAIYSFGLRSVSSGSFARAEASFSRLIKETPNSVHGRLALIANAGILYRTGWPRYASNALASAEAELSSLPHELLKGTLPGYAGWAHVLEPSSPPQPSWLQEYSKASDPSAFAEAKGLANVLASASHFSDCPEMSAGQQITGLRDSSGNAYLTYLGGHNVPPRVTLRVCALNPQTGRIREYTSNEQLRHIRFLSPDIHSDEARFLAIYTKQGPNDSGWTDHLGYFVLDLKGDSVHLVAGMVLDDKTLAGGRPGTVYSWQDPGHQNLVKIALRHARNWSYHLLSLQQDGTASLSSPASNLSQLSARSMTLTLLAGNFVGDDGLEIFFGLSEWQSYSIYLLRQQEDSHDFDLLSEQLFGANTLACILPGPAATPHAYDRILVNKWQTPSHYHNNLLIFGRFRPGGVDPSTQLLDYDKSTAEFRLVASEPTGDIHTLFRTPLALATGDLDGDGKPEIMQLLATTLPDRPHAVYPWESARSVQVLRIPDQGTRFRTAILASCDATYMTTADLDADPADELILFSPKRDSETGTISIYGYTSKE